MSDYWIRKDNKVKGGFQKEEILRKIQLCSLKSLDEISMTENGPWERIGKSEFWSTPSMGSSSYSRPLYRTSTPSARTTVTPSRMPRLEERRPVRSFNSSAQEPIAVVEENFKLNGDQMRIYDIPLSKRILIKGPAGSGKTTVAAYRAIWAACNHDFGENPNILILAYNKNLVDNFLLPIISKRKEAEASITVKTLHAYANRVKPLNCGERVNFREVEILERTITSLETYCKELNVNVAFANGKSREVRSFYEAEFEWMTGQLIDSFEKYYSCERTGRGARANLDRAYQIFKDKERKVIWRAFETYWNECKKEGIVDFNMSLRGAYDELSANPQYCYTHVIIDEAQDFSPLMMNIALSQIDLSPSRNGVDAPNGITLVASDRQQIYGRETSWKQRMSGKVGPLSYHNLTKNYRNPEDIKMLAEKFYATLKDGADDESCQNVQTSVPIKNILWVKGADESIVQAYLKRHYADDKNAVLLWQTRGKELSWWDKERSVKWRKFKGGEADTVIVYGLTEFYLPGSKGFKEQEADQYMQNAKLFYTLITRARKRLVLVSWEDERDKPSYFLCTLDSLSGNQIQKERGDE
ncbi:MAG: UvrD-helicase domain-containing protein [Kiritimatiellia bacterium]